MKEYPVQRAAVLKPKPDPDTLVFGKTFTDHMFIMDYTAGQGWHDGRIVPYGPLALEPSAMVLHYAQEVFEGLKAYRGPDGGVQLFRPMENVRRINSSCERMCIPPLPEEDALAAIEQLVRLEAGWVPSKPGTSLYIRPFIIATTPSLGVHAAHDYLFCIITCPVGAYYAEGINPVKIYVENEDVRAVKGGTGYTKCGGNTTPFAPIWSGNCAIVAASLPSFTAFSPSGVPSNPTTITSDLPAVCRARSAPSAISSFCAKTACTSGCAVSRFCITFRPLVRSKSAG